MRLVVTVLAVLSSLGQGAGFWLLLGQRKVARAVLAQESRHVIDGGRASGESDGPDSATAFDDLAAAMIAEWKVLGALLFGLACGLAATLVSLYVPG